MGWWSSSPEPPVSICDRARSIVASGISNSLPGVRDPLSALRPNPVHRLQFGNPRFDNL
jgi:hypothetical protein